MPEAKMRTWNVRVHRKGHSTYLGTVQEKSEELARCAALSLYGTEDENCTDEDFIGPFDDFDVSPANI